MAIRYKLKEKYTELKKITKEAIEFLEANCPNDKFVFVGFSGGKDSIVIEKLMQLSKLKYKSYFSNTGMEFPEIIQFIKKYYPNCIFLSPSRNFWHLVTSRNPPLSSKRWCCIELKKRPSWRIPYYHRVMGIRKEESRKRSKYNRINHFSTNKNQRPEHIQYYPILNWKEYQVWEFIEYFKLPYPIIYDNDIGKTGCIVCIYHSANKGQHHKILKDKYPTFFKLFERKVNEWFYKRLKQGRTMANTSPEAFLKDWYIGKAKWYGPKPLRIKLNKRKETNT